MPRHELHWVDQRDDGPEGCIEITSEDAIALRNILPIVQELLERALSKAGVEVAPPLYVTIAQFQSVPALDIAQ